MKMIDEVAIERLLLGAQRRVEIWREIDKNAGLDDFHHSTGFAQHMGELKMIQTVKGLLV
jgi:hypothetical protein